MSTHPEESLPGHSANAVSGDASWHTLTVGALRQSLRDLPADTLVMVTVEASDIPRPARYAHHGNSGTVLIIDARQARLPRQAQEDQ